MGGLGSGNYVRLGSRHGRVEEVRSFDLATLRRHKCLTGKARVWHWQERHDRPAIDIGVVAHDWGVRFLWKRKGMWQESRVCYGFTSVPFGTRRWFCCPYCRRNCRTVYWTDPAVMLCRTCANLRYASQSEEPHWRAHRKADALRRRLGAGDNNRGEFPPKPRNMHSSTYWRLWKRHNDFSEAWSRGMTASFAKLEKRAAKSLRHLPRPRRDDSGII